MKTAINFTHVSFILIMILEFLIFVVECNLRYQTGLFEIKMYCFDQFSFVVFSYELKENIVAKMTERVSL